MKDRNILLTGLQRSGTTLACHLLNKVINTAALHEPLLVQKYAKENNNESFIKFIDDFFLQSRKSLLRDTTALTRTFKGQVPDNPFANDVDSNIGLRRCIHGEPEITSFQKTFNNEMYIIVKHTAAFTAHLKSLVDAFPVFAIIRNPFSVLMSWQTCDMYVNRGRVPAAEVFSKSLKVILEKEKYVLNRQIKILHWFFDSYKKHLSPDKTIKYEDIIETKGTILSLIVPNAESLNEELNSRNLNPLYPRNLFEEVGNALINSEGSAWHFYNKSDIIETIHSSNT